MSLLNLNHLKMLLNALNIKYAELADDQLLAWLNQEGVVKPATSASGALYTTNNNQIYVL